MGKSHILCFLTAGKIIIIAYGQKEIVQEFVSNRKQLVTRLVDVITRADTMKKIIFVMRGNKEGHINLLTPDIITLRLITWEVGKSGLKTGFKPVVR